MPGSSARATRLLEALRLASGNPGALPELLLAIASSERDRRLRGTLTRLSDRLRAGHGWHETLLETRSILPRTVLGLVLQGGRGLHLPGLYARAQELLTWRASGRTLWRRAWLGPGLTLGIGLLLWTVLAPRILPELARLTRQAPERAAPGRILLDAILWIDVHPWVVYLPALVTLLVLALAPLGARFESLRRLAGRVQLGLPLVGKLERQRLVLAVCLYATAAIEARMAPPAVLAELGCWLDNAWLEARYRERVRLAEAGVPLSACLFVEGVFPEAARSKLASAERASRLELGLADLGEALREDYLAALEQAAVPLCCAATLVAALFVVAIVLVLHGPLVLLSLEIA